jgi:hypothetical protein
MTDKFMSGWGKADHLTNKLIFICDSWSEANIVADNASDRSDMIYINVCANKPKCYRSTFGSDYESSGYYVQIKTKDDYPSWYEPGFFMAQKLAARRAGK